MKRRFKRIKPKYEVTVLMSHEDYIDERLDELQKSGWEISGDILVKNKDGHCTHTYLFIPLKRKKQ